MATNIPQTRQVSTPQLLINGYPVAYVPNSLKWRIPGDFKVRAMTTGGAGTKAVAGLDATDLLGKVDFELPATAANDSYVRQLKADMFNGLGCTVQIANPQSSLTIAYQVMFFSKSVDFHAKSDGNIGPLELEGQYVQ